MNVFSQVSPINGPENDTVKVNIRDLRALREEFYHLEQKVIDLEARIDEFINRLSLECEGVENGKTD